MRFTTAKQEGQKHQNTVFKIKSKPKEKPPKVQFRAHLIEHVLRPRQDWFPVVVVCEFPLCEAHVDLVHVPDARNQLQPVPERHLAAHEAHLLLLVCQEPLNEPTQKSG